MTWIRKAVRETVAAPAEALKGVFDGLDKAIDEDDWNFGDKKERKEKES